MNDPRQNKLTANRVLFEVLGGGDISNPEELVTETWTLDDPDFARPEWKGPEGLAAFTTKYHQVFGDPTFEILRQDATTETVTTKWTMDARLIGEIFDLPARGEPVHITGLTFDEVDEETGRISQTTRRWDAAGIQDQIRNFHNEI